MYCDGGEALKWDERPGRREHLSPYAKEKEALGPL